MKGQSTLFSSASHEHATPQDYFDKLNAIYNFTLDPTATKENAKCAKFYTKEDSCFKYQWNDERVFMNPPYGEPEFPCKNNCKKKRCVQRGWHTDEYIPGCIDFVSYAVDQHLAYDILLVMLLPVRTDTGWFQDHIYPYWQKNQCEILFHRGRLKFGNAKSSAPFPSMTVVYSKRYE